MKDATSERVLLAQRDRLTTLLEQHASAPVLWRDSIDAVASSHPDACFVEVGPGAVLFNLLQKRWHDNRKLRTDDPVDPAGHLARVLAELGDAS